MSAFDIPPQLKQQLEKIPVTRQPDHYKSRTKTQAQLAKSIASLPPPPAANKKVMSEAMATKFQSADFWTSLDQFAQDPTFGLGLSASDAEEFKKLFKKEHRNKVKGLKTEEMESFLLSREAFNSKSA